MREMSNSLKLNANSPHPNSYFAPKGIIYTFQAMVGPMENNIIKKLAYTT